jgi:hypothetical protein
MNDKEQKREARLQRMHERLGVGANDLGMSSGAI